MLGFLLLLALAQVFFQIQNGETIPYSDFKVLVRENKIQEVFLSDDRLHGTLKPVGNEKTGKPFSAVRVDRRQAAGRPRGARRQVHR